jgi:hypothetical protein
MDAGAGPHGVICRHCDRHTRGWAVSTKAAASAPPHSNVKQQPITRRVCSRRPGASGRAIGAGAACLGEYPILTASTALINLLVIDCMTP